MKVLVFGGTHGNEWTGVTTVFHYADRFKRKFPGLDLHFIHANPEAYRMNKRFKDEDLNRAFEFLGEDRKHSYENQRAREIKKMIEASPCYVIDLHTTTSNMGATVIVTHPNDFNLQLVARLSQAHPDCKIILSPDPQKKYLGSQSELGLMIEVGPIANGLVSAEALESTHTLLTSLLHALETPLPSRGHTLHVYEEIENIYYPLDERGQIAAYIHPAFQGKDFLPLQGPYTPFMTFDERPLTSTTQEELFPIFINEAAYYPAKLAFTLCRRIKKEL